MLIIYIHKKEEEEEKKAELLAAGRMWVNLTQSDCDYRHAGPSWIWEGAVQMLTYFPLSSIGIHNHLSESVQLENSVRM